MRLYGLEPRRNDLARGIVIARAIQPLDAAAQRAVWERLAQAGVTQLKDRSDDSESEPSRQWLAATWIPPTADEIDAQRTALDDAATTHGLEAIWCVKVETGIDGVAWLELGSAEAAADFDEPTVEVESAEGDQPVEVLYTAPDVPALSVTGEAVGSEPDDEDDEDADDDEDDEDEDADDDEDDDAEIPLLESYWRNGPPPFERTVEFPIERYPEIIDSYTSDSFGVSIKLDGPSLAGEESVINAFFTLWLSVYEDERVEGFEPFHRADVIHDRRHRSAMMRVEQFAVPATPPDQVHFLLWIIARINDVIPLVWSRFRTGSDEASDSDDSGETTGGPEGLARAHHVLPSSWPSDDDSGDDPGSLVILAGNPLAERFRRLGEEAAIAWAVGQSVWSRRELAEMLIEIALEDGNAASVAESLLRRAVEFDASSDAATWLCTVLIHQGKVEDAVELARGSSDHTLRMVVVSELAMKSPDALLGALDVLDPQTLRTTTPEQLAELAVTIARHAPACLDPFLEQLPTSVALVPYLYNESFRVDRPLGLAILRKVLALPIPAEDTGEIRMAFAMAWNNACIYAHELGQYELAAELADGGQPYALENPYIYHSAACAYAAVGQVDRAIQQVANALEYGYEHSEKMETDADLEPLRSDPRFSALFVEWRTRRADLN